MKWKTLTLDAEAYRLIKRAKRPRESFNDVVRRVFGEAEIDIDAHLGDLLQSPPAVDVALLRRRQKNPPRSNHPSRGGRRNAV